MGAERDSLIGLRLDRVFALSLIGIMPGRNSKKEIVMSATSHHTAAKSHEETAKSHKMAAEHHEKGDHKSALEHSTKASGMSGTAHQHTTDAHKATQNTKG